jgi:curved DNA-binding protein CbpA
VGSEEEVSAVDTPRSRRDFYAVLGVEPTATSRQITSAYRRLVRVLHPDTRSGRDVERDLAEVLAAYDTLRDPDRRAAYDAEHGHSAHKPLPGCPIPVRVTRTPGAPAPHRTPPTRSSRPPTADPQDLSDLATWVHRWLWEMVRWL